MGGVDSAAENLHAESRKNESPRDTADGIRLVRLYRISNGKSDSVAFTGRELMNGLEVDGYVSGVVVVCDREMVVRVDGRPMRRIGITGDGMLRIERFGKIAPEEIAPQMLEATESGESRNDHADAVLPGGYSLFPDVRGDSLSPAERFDIEFESEGGTFSVSIRQDACQTLHRECLDSDRRESGVVFRYFGSGVDRLRERVSDFEERLHAIEEGIASVESVRGSGVVRGVNIIDYESVRNAVACDGSDDIWFYVYTFRSEPVAELRTMAAHETLHILVDKSGFARDSEVRELFARLRGHDEFSRERFAIVTSGVAPRRKPEQCLEGGSFFSFIDERNFIEGMKGGHSHTSVEEFCVSLIHSLMFLENFEQNLERPIKLSDASGGLRPLTSREKAFIVDSYLAAIETLARALDSGNNQTLARMKAFLRGNLARASAIRKSREM